MREDEGFTGVRDRPTTHYSPHINDYTENITYLRSLVMVHVQSQPLTLDDFLALPEGDIIYELVDGQAIPKFSSTHFDDPHMSPKFFHSSIAGSLLVLLSQWSQSKGRVRIEWGVSLTRNGNPWVPVPDLIYISYDRLPREWIKDEACPVCPELAIEIISIGQTFGDMVEKATNYLAEGISCVWIIDPKANSVTVFEPNTLPKTYRGSQTITIAFGPTLDITPQQIFQQAGLL